MDLLTSLLDKVSLTMLVCIYRTYKVARVYITIALIGFTDTLTLVFYYYLSFNRN